MNFQTIFLVHSACTLYLVGLIWTIQQVHYPLMDRVGDEQFVRYERDHGQSITPIVGPPMVIELFTALLIVSGNLPPWMPRWTAVAGLAAVALIWLSTFLLQVPYHDRLLSGFDAEVHRKLVTTNWVRTILWTARGALVIYWLGRALQGSATPSLES